MKRYDAEYDEQDGPYMEDSDTGDYIKHEDHLEDKKKDRELYNELIMAVATKFPDESRHETALRYIKDAENRESGPCMAVSEDK